MNNGIIPEKASKLMQDKAIELGLSKMDAPAKFGGLDLPMVQQVVIWEELGRVTNALCWCFPEAQSWMFDACKLITTYAA